MESPKPSLRPPNPLLSISSFIHHHCHRITAELASKLDETKRIASNWTRPPVARNPSPLQLFSPSPFATISQNQEGRQGKHLFDVALSSDYVAKTLAGTSVYTVSNSNNEFVLVSDPNSLKSIGLLCFRQEDAEAFLAQVRLRKGELRSKARVVPITLDQVYQLKVEGIAFRFLPDPVQIKNALELKSSATKSGFDGVPVFQSDLLVVKKRKRRYCPIYFRKEDIEKELTRVSRGPGVSQHIMYMLEFCLGGGIQTKELKSGPIRTNRENWGTFCLALFVQIGRIDAGAAGCFWKHPKSALSCSGCIKYYLKGPLCCVHLSRK